MNIFILDADIATSVKYHCDKHIVKMPLEAAQIICTVRHHYKLPAIYKPFSPNHPIVKWAAKSVYNYTYVIQYFRYLAYEFKYRYSKEHLSFVKLKDIALYIPIDIFPSDDRNIFCCCTGETRQLDKIHAINAYRKYYQTTKRHLTNKYTKRDIPAWL